MKKPTSMIRNWALLALATTGCALETGTGWEEVAETEQALIGDVTVDKVRACRNSLLCNSYVTQSQYGYWDQANVAQDKQKETYLSRFAEPSRADTEYVAMLFAGQQAGGGDYSRLTGQRSDWEKGWSSQTASEVHNLRSDSIGARLLDPDYFPAGKTFAGAAFDARFNYGFSAENKQEIENAYYEWLKSKFYRSRIRVLYLAGHSRGGCLALRLARRFKNDFPELGVIVHSFDAVCHKVQNEFGIEGNGAQIENPKNDRYWSWETDFSAQFPNTNRLAVLH